MTLVTEGALFSLLEWAGDAIDFDDQSDRNAANAFDILVRELAAGSTAFGCIHGTERGFLCHYCGAEDVVS